MAVNELERVRQLQAQIYELQQSDVILRRELALEEAETAVLERRIQEARLGPASSAMTDQPGVRAAQDQIAQLDSEIADLRIKLASVRNLNMSFRRPCASSSFSQGAPPRPSFENWEQDAPQVEKTRVGLERQIRTHEEEASALKRSIALLRMQVKAPSQAPTLSPEQLEAKKILEQQAKLQAENMELQRAFEAKGGVFTEDADILCTQYRLREDVTVKDVVAEDTKEVEALIQEKVNLKVEFERRCAEWEAQLERMQLVPSKTQVEVLEQDSGPTIERLRGLLCEKDQELAMLRLQLAGYAGIRSSPLPQTVQPATPVADQASLRSWASSTCSSHQAPTQSVVSVGPSLSARPGEF